MSFRLVINDQMNKDMMSKVKHEEVKKAIFTMNKYKAHGPDGFLPTFFQEIQDIVMYDVIHIARDFVRMGQLLKKLNQIFIIIVPEMEDPRRMEDFRPYLLTYLSLWWRF